MAMGGSKQTQTTDMGPWKAVQGDIKAALPDLKQGYQNFQNNPLIPQAQGYTSDVMSGKYLDPNTNPHLGALTKAITDPIQASVSAQFGRAGRGTSASSSGLGGAMTQAMTSGLAAPLFNQYNTERAMQQQASQMAPSMAALDTAPVQWYTDQLAKLGSLGKQGTSTITEQPGLGSTIFDASMMGLGALMTPINPTSMLAKGLSGALPWYSGGGSAAP